MSGPLHILVVDDAPEIRALLRALLEAEPVVVSEAGSGDEAVAAVRDGGAFDLVVLDHNMPGMDGLEALHELQALVPSLPIVSCTCQPDLEQAYLQAGAAGHFGKENLDALIDYIRERCGDGDGRRP